MEAPAPRPEPCPRCGAAMHAARVRTAIWREERLFVVEEIPAQVCESCREQFYDEETAETLRRLTEDSFASLAPKKEIVVPVFSLGGRIHRREAGQEDVVAESY